MCWHSKYCWKPLLICYVYSTCICINFVCISFCRMFIYFDLILIAFSETGKHSVAVDGWVCNNNNNTAENDNLDENETFVHMCVCDCRNSEIIGNFYMNIIISRINSNNCFFLFFFFFVLIKVTTKVFFFCPFLL